MLAKTSPKNGAYWKRYGRRSTRRTMSVNEIRIIARQVLDLLHFLYGNGFVYGHLHSSNILFDEGQAQPVKFLDMVNTINGVSSKYRGYASSLKQIRVS